MESRRGKLTSPQTFEVPVRPTWSTLNQTALRESVLDSVRLSHISLASESENLRCAWKVALATSSWACCHISDNWTDFDNPKSVVNSPQKLHNEP